VVDSTRDDLIEKVRYGEISPAQAEAEAVRLKLERLAQCPDKELFDPMKETFWTLPMAIAWIAYRTADEVVSWWDPYRTTCWDWQFRRWRIGFDGPVHEGYFLEQRKGATLAVLGIASIFDEKSDKGPTMKMSVKEAKESALRIALEQGLIEALGINSATGVKEKIAAPAWHDLEFHEENERDVVATPLTWSGQALRFEQIIVWRKAVTGMWPDAMPPPLALPETMAPTGPGYMPLYSAAQWIATIGGSQAFDPNDEAIWKRAFDDLLARISSEEVKTIGVRNGERELVPAHHFAACRVDYPFSGAPMELVMSEELYLRSYPYVDEKHWNSGFDDSLLDRRGERWSRLMVLKEDVGRIWQFVEDRRGETGAPGRPSSMYLVEAHFKARCEGGEIAASLTREAEILAQWLSKSHPDKPPLREKTICNRLRSAYREYQNAQK
jgi:hypothetical protein